jgi:predicted RNase H-like HicB family nuclease
MNTPKKGRVRCITFKDGDTWYGVALEFNIVETANDPEIARINLEEAMKGYVETQNIIKGSRLSPLNQKPDAEYEKLWKQLNSPRASEAPFEVKYFGVMSV